MTARKADSVRPDVFEAHLITCDEDGCKSVGPLAFDANCNEKFCREHWEASWEAERQHPTGTLAVAT